MKGNGGELSRQKPGGFHCLHIQAVNRRKTDRQSRGCQRTQLLQNHSFSVSLSLIMYKTTRNSQD